MNGTILEEADGQARRHDAHCGFDPRQGYRTGPGSPSDLRGLAATLQPRMPGGGEHPGLARPGPGGQVPRGLGTLVRDNPMPAVHGRVCYHPCEGACNRSELDASVSIHAVERFLGDLATQEGWPFPMEAPPSGKRVLVIGAGPSGLSAGYHLARLGHTVEIHEAGPLPGGMMHFGIPAYRLPRADLMREIARIEAMGVRIVLNHKVEDLLAEKSAGKFRCGLHRHRRGRRQACGYSGARRGARARRRIAVARRQIR